MTKNEEHASCTFGSEAGGGAVNSCRGQIPAPPLSSKEVGTVSSSGCVPTSDSLSRVILGPEAAAGYIIKPRRGPVQNLLIGKSFHSIKPCEKSEGVGEGRRGNSWGGVLREETSSQRPGGDVQSSGGMERPLWRDNSQHVIAVKVSRPHNSQFSNSSHGLLGTATFPREVCPGQLRMQSATSLVPLTTF